MKKQKIGWKKSLLIIIFSMIIIVAVAKAGTVTPPSGIPSAQFHTLSEIYEFIDNNTAATVGTHGFLFSDALEGTSRTLTEIYDVLAGLVTADQVKLDTTYLNVDGTLVPSGGDATTADILTDKTFFGASQTDWDLQTGTMADNSSFGLTCSISDQSVATGYYSGGTLAGDADLVSANIKSGINIFGVAGDSNVVDTSSGTVDNNNLIRSSYIAFSDGLSYSGSLADCSSEGEQSCYATGSYYAGTQQSLSNATTTVNAGYYTATTLVAVDADLLAANIWSSKNIFGIAGTLLTSPTFGDNDAAKVLTIAANNGTYDATNLTVANVRNTIEFGVGLTGTFSGNLLYGDDDAAKVLTIASNSGTYDATNLSVGIVKAGITFGVASTGTLAPSGDAAQANCLNLKTFYSGDSWTQKTGSMANNSSFSLTCSISNQSVATGYYSGGTLAGDADLVSANIKSGINIFGVAGDSNVVDTSSGTVNNNNLIRSGYVAYSDGAQYTGDMANCSDGNTSCYASGGVWASDGNCNSQGDQSCRAAGSYYAAINCGEGGSSCYASGGKWYGSECANIGAETTCYIDGTTRYVYGEASYSTFETITNSAGVTVTCTCSGGYTMLACGTGGAQSGDTLNWARAAQNLELLSGTCTYTEGGANVACIAVCGQ